MHDINGPNIVITLGFLQYKHVDDLHGDFYNMNNVYKSKINILTTF